MTTQIKTPTDDELREAVQCVTDGAELTIRERVPYSDEPEFREHETDNVAEAMSLAQDIRWNDAVGSEIVFIEVRGDGVAQRFDDDDERTESRTNIKVSADTKRNLDECKRDGETWDGCLQRLAQLDRISRTN